MVKSHKTPALYIEQAAAFVTVVKGTELAEFG